MAFTWTLLGSVPRPAAGGAAPPHAPPGRGVSAALPGRPCRITTGRGGQDVLPGSGYDDTTPPPAERTSRHAALRQGCPRARPGPVVRHRPVLHLRRRPEPVPDLRRPDGSAAGGAPALAARPRR